MSAVQSSWGSWCVSDTSRGTHSNVVATELGISTTVCEDIVGSIGVDLHERILIREDLSQNVAFRGGWRVVLGLKCSSHRMFARCNPWAQA